MESRSAEVGEAVESPTPTPGGLVNSDLRFGRGVTFEDSAGG